MCLIDIPGTGNLTKSHPGEIAGTKRVAGPVLLEQAQRCSAKITPGWVRSRTLHREDMMGSSSVGRIIALSEYSPGEDISADETPSPSLNPDWKYFGQ